MPPPRVARAVRAFRKKGPGGEVVHDLLLEVPRKSLEALFAGSTEARGYPGWPVTERERPALEGWLGTTLNLKRFDWFVQAEDEETGPDAYAPRQPLAETIRCSLGTHDFVLLPEDRRREVEANTWCFGVGAGPLESEDVAAAFEAAAVSLRARLSGRDGPATFYLWYDELAGQLRCSLHSGSSETLPFGRRYELVAAALDIVRLAAADQSPGVIPWADLRQVGPDEPDEPRPPLPPLPIWAVEVA